MNIQEVKESIGSIDLTSTRFAIIAFTDEYFVGKWDENTKNKLDEKLELALEARIFNENEEYKYFRADISKEFVYRIKNDKDSQEDYYDEEQFLDIDDTRTNGDTVYTTGGGKFNLPITNKKDAKIKIRYYLGKYEETGHVRIEDWRVVKFVEGI